MSTEGVLKLLIDNVWMDYFSGRSDRTANVVHLIEIAHASERIALFASSLSWPRRFISCRGNQAGVPKKDWLTER